MGLKRIKETIGRLLRMENSTHQLAFSFATGVFIAFCPLLGLHTVLALFLVWLFRLNMVALFLGCFVNNPWTFLPILGGSFWLGTYLYPSPQPIPPLVWSMTSIWSLYGTFRPYIVPFILGGTVLGLVSASVTYVVAFYLIQQWRERIRIAGKADGTLREKPP